MKDVSLPPDPPETDFDNLEFATEVAFNALRDRAIQDGLLPMNVEFPFEVVSGTDAAVAQRFSDACRAVIDLLRKSEGAGPVQNPNS